MTTNSLSIKAVFRLDPVDDNGMATGKTMLATKQCGSDFIGLDYTPTVEDMFADDWEELGLLLVNDVVLNTNSFEPSTIEIEVNRPLHLGHG